MRLLFVVVMLIGATFSTPIFAQNECCQCGPSACGPAPEGGGCGECTLVSNATCEGESGQCLPALEGSLPPPVATAPALGASALALLAASMTVLAFSVLARRRRQT